MSTPSPVETPRTLAVRLNAARAAYADAVRLAGAGDLKARSRLSALRREQEELEREYAVECDLAAERARLSQDAAAVAERERRREGLDLVDATFTEQIALAKHADALFDEIADTLAKLAELGATAVRTFRANCTTPRLSERFVQVGLNSSSVLQNELLRRLWKIPPIAVALRSYGCGAVYITGTPSLEESLRAKHRRALGVLDDARAEAAEPDLPPAA